MHHFDHPHQASDSGVVFEKMLTELMPGQTDKSPQAQSEVGCFWMALAVLCPEKHRKAFDEERIAGRIDAYAIALQLRIPEVYVPYLFNERYKNIIDALRKKKGPVSTV